MAGSVDDVSHKEETCGFLEAVCAFWGSVYLTTSWDQEASLCTQMWDHY